MQDTEFHAARARKNQLLGLVLFAASLGVLGMMIAVVSLTRNGVLAHLLHHLGRLY
jgi:hypothetical protein